jgi:uncharacterized protein YbjT (DUF2867 family)
MKIVLTGGAGNITKPLAETLLTMGHEVTVIGRNAENLKALQHKGVIPAIGNIEDEAFLTAAFKGADVVYTMVPTPYHVPDLVAYGTDIGNKYAKAIAANNIKRVVNLSTHGAHRLEGIGPAHLLGQIEKALDALEDTAIIHIRAGYFYSNLENQLPAIKQNGIIGANFGNADNVLLLVHTDDIADIVAKAITAPLFNNGEPIM